MTVRPNVYCSFRYRTSAAAAESLRAEAASCAAECCRISPAAKTPGMQVRIQMSVTPPANHTTRSQPDKRTLMRGFHDTSHAPTIWFTIITQPLC
jgi:hypothetical protein